MVKLRFCQISVKYDSLTDTCDWCTVMKSLALNLTSIFNGVPVLDLCLKSVQPHKQKGWLIICRLRLINAPPPPSLAKLPTTHQYKNHDMLEGWPKHSIGQNRRHSRGGRETETGSTSSWMNTLKPNDVQLFFNRQVPFCWSPDFGGQKLLYLKTKTDLTLCCQYHNSLDGLVI